LVSFRFRRADAPDHKPRTPVGVVYSARAFCAVELRRVPWITGRRNVGPFTQLPDVLQYQVVLEERRLAIVIVLRPDTSRETLERVAAGIRAALQDAGAVPPPIEVEPVDAIEREPRGAKLKLVKTTRR
jgi:hypothetical protein